MILRSISALLCAKSDCIGWYVGWVGSQVHAGDLKDRGCTAAEAEIQRGFIKVKICARRHSPFVHAMALRLSV
jgi:hypothetical protein